MAFGRMLRWLVRSENRWKTEDSNGSANKNEVGAKFIAKLPRLRRKLAAHALAFLERPK